jgi:Homeodomain-like domain
MEERMGNKKYRVKLTAEEREQLEGMLRKGRGSAQHLLKARILLKADEGESGEHWSDGRICEALSTYPVRVELVRKQLALEGVAAVFTRKKRDVPPVALIFDGEKEAQLIKLACSKPPEGRSRWTLQLLAERLVELRIVDHVSDDTVRLTLKKTRFSLI